VVIVSPDAGGVERARAFAKRLDAGLAIIDKRRDAPNKAKAMAVIGDVKDKVAIILDDMVDTAGTLTEAAEPCCATGPGKFTPAAPIRSSPVRPSIASR
jgi:ribose-phosphate pyrophosphokinase